MKSALLWKKSKVSPSKIFFQVSISTWWHMVFPELSNDRQEPPTSTHFMLHGLPRMWHVDTKFINCPDEQLSGIVWIATSRHCSEGTGIDTICNYWLNIVELLLPNGSPSKQSPHLVCFPPVTAAFQRNLSQRRRCLADSTVHDTLYKLCRLVSGNQRYR